MPIYIVRQTTDRWIEIQARNEDEAIEKAEIADEGSWTTSEGEFEIDEDETSVDDDDRSCGPRK